MNQLKFKRLTEGARTPTYGTCGAACFDLYAVDDVSIGANAAGTVSTGVAFDIPQGYVILVYSRSGHGFKSGVRLANCTGVVDSDYRGEVMVRLTNDSRQDFHVSRGDRIAQAMLMPVDQWRLVETDTLSATDRGAQGFGSTGQ